jgi:hypothetical protein
MKRFARRGGFVKKILFDVFEHQGPPNFDGSQLMYIFILILRLILLSDENILKFNIVSLIINFFHSKIIQ